MRSLLIVGQMRPDTLRHHQDETAIIHVQPITARNKLIVGVAREWAIGFGAKIGLIEAGHKRFPNAV
jgi:hypothetical protein